MSIKEKKKPIEFTYSPDDTICPDPSMVQYDIIYNEDLIKDNIINFPLTIIRGNQELNCPVELLEEVLEFLMKRGIVERPVNPFVVTPNVESKKSSGNILPIPEIERSSEKENTVPQISPVTSFDVDPNNPLFLLEKNKVGIKEEVSSNSLPKNKKGIIIDTNTKMDIPNRPVIRTTHVSDDEDGDPRSAEKQAAILRGKPNQDKKIRRIEN
jgi:hypothetical protein